MASLVHSEITGKIIRSFYEVYNSLGPGFLEKVYENALALELRSSGLIVEQQRPIEVFYKSTRVGEYFADIFVDKKVIVELKAVETLLDIHEAQLLNYLKATQIEVGLLLNFGRRPEHKRRLLTNDRKSLLTVLLDP
ncbi:MAG: GxxExxY protein [Pyrinomonadaceae bacterium]